MVNCPTAGGLKDAIAAAKLDYTKVTNLKITGEINDVDFIFMRNSMKALEALNLKEVTIAKSGTINPGEKDEIPMGAMQNTKLNYLVLPDRLKGIRSSAFIGCK